MISDLNSLLIRIDSNFWIGQVTNRIFEKIKEFCSKSTIETNCYVIKKNLSDCHFIKLSGGKELIIDKYESYLRKSCN